MLMRSFCIIRSHCATATARSLMDHQAALLSASMSKKKPRKIFSNCDERFALLMDLNEVVTNKR